MTIDRQLAPKYWPIDGNRTISFPYKRDAEGRSLCRWCWGEIADRRRSTWCSDACVREFKGRYDPQHQRQLVEGRDRGVCASCQLDTDQLARRLNPEPPYVHFESVYEHFTPSMKATIHEQNLEKCKQVRDELALYETAVAEWWEFINRSENQWAIRRGRRSLWEMDHVVPLSEGGNGGLDNLRTLCLPCHRQATKALAGRRAVRRRGCAQLTIDQPVGE